MNKQLLLTLLVVLSVLFSVSAVCASEVSVTDSYATSLVDDTSDVSVYSYAASSDISVSSDSNVDNDSSKVSLSSEEVLESENSNTLSTNTDSSELTAGAVSTKLITPGRTVNIKDAVAGFDYQIILRDTNGNPISGKTVSFNFNGITTTGITNSNGLATAKLTSDTSGTYDVKVTFKGDANYNKVSQVGSVKIIKNEVNFVAPDRTLYLDDISAGYIYPVILRDSEGNAISQRNVTLTFNGKKLTETTDNKGYCYFNITADKAGSYGVNLRFDGDQYYYGKSCSDFKTVEVIVKKNVTFIAPDRTIHVDTIANGYSYPVLLRDTEGNALAKKQISLIFNGKQYDGTTNSKGYCYFNISVNRAGSYPVTIRFAGDKYYCSNSALHFKTVTVIKRNVTFIAPDRSVYLDDISGGYSYPVLLRDTDGYALANKPITLTFNGKTLTGTTNNKGYCYFDITANKAGSYAVGLKFAGDRYCNSLIYSNFKTVEVIVMKNVTFVAPDRTLHLADIYEGYSYPVLLKDSNGNALANKKVILTFNGKNLTATTNSKGFCYFNIQVDKAGSYGITLEFEGDKYYYPNLISNFKTVNVLRHDTGIAWKSGTSFGSESQTFKILLTDNGVALSNREVKLTINSKTYSAKTASNGYATFNLNLNLKAGTYTVSYSYDGENWYNPSSGSTKITVVGSSKVSINDILTASETVKNYYANNGKLPSTVTLSGRSFTMPEFLYLMSQAIYQLGNSNTNPVSCIYDVKNPSSPSGDNINDKLYKADYITAAKAVADYIKSNNQAPNYASSAIGKIHYTEFIDASARILAFYKNNDKYMPNYVSVSYNGGGSGSYSGPGNVVNTITNLDPYYQATKNCQVNNSAIKSVVDSLTKGLTTAEQKAIALYNYVRDQVSYSFYYNTKYGAVGTLNAKTGNCVDQAHLLIAMYRTAGLAARYEHGTCYFTLSGSTYGHVWPQVLIGNTWVVSDPTSNRNSFGKVVNWNVNSYTHHGYYASLSF